MQGWLYTSTVSYLPNFQLALSHIEGTSSPPLTTFPSILDLSLVMVVCPPETYIVLFAVPEMTSNILAVLELLYHYESRSQISCSPLWQEL